MKTRDGKSALSGTGYSLINERLEIGAHGSAHKKLDTSTQGWIATTRDGKNIEVSAAQMDINYKECQAKNGANCIAINDKGIVAIKADSKVVLLRDVRDMLQDRLASDPRESTNIYLTNKGEFVMIFDVDGKKKYINVPAGSFAKMQNGIIPPTNFEASSESGWDTLLRTINKGVEQMEVIINGEQRGTIKPFQRK